MHPIDIDATLKTFSVVVDSREQKWGHIEKALKATETPYTQHKLNYGDYTCKAVKPNSEPVSLAQSVVIERKANLDEIVGNFTKGRERFDREFKRSVEDHAKVFLMVEDDRLWENILLHNYRSKMPPKALLATFCSWQARYNITIIACRKQESGTLIKAILYYALRDYLQKLGGD
jgi:ERCC4-type nuclease